MCKTLFCFLLLLPLITFSQNNTFFSQALKQNHALLNRILNHPFNQKLNQGTLDRVFFNAFLEQDHYYLNVYDHLAHVLYQRLPKKQKNLFMLTHSLGDEIKINSQLPAILTSANKFYTTFLINTANNGSNPVLIAAMLPCQWLYQRVYSKMSTQNNPYQYWLQTYQTQSYQRVTKSFIKLANQIYVDSNHETQIAMIHAFKQSMNYEYQFWRDIWVTTLCAINKRKYAELSWGHTG